MMTADEAFDLGPRGPELARNLKFWAQCMAARFSAPVLMIGSALYSPTPRDIDIRIVISDEQFRGRYAINDVEAWAKVDRGQPWIDDMAKMNRTLALSFNVDIQVWPKSHWKAWEPFGLEPLVLADVSPSWCITPENVKARKKRRKRR